MVMLYLGMARNFIRILNTFRGLLEFLALGLVHFSNCRAVNIRVSFMDNVKSCIGEEW